MNAVLWDLYFHFTLMSYYGWNILHSDKWRNLRFSDIHQLRGCLILELKTV